MVWTPTQSLNEPPSFSSQGYAFSNPGSRTSSPSQRLGSPLAQQTNGATLSDGMIPISRASAPIVKPTFNIPRSKHLPAIVFGAILLACFLVISLTSNAFRNPFSLGTGRVISETGKTVTVGHQGVSPPAPGVSLVVVCMNRHSTLQEVIKYWLGAENVDEVIIVDWNSDPPLEQVVRKYSDPRLVLARVEDEDDWVLTRAFNVGMSMATKDKLLKLDCDYALSPNFVSKHPLRKQDKIFYSGDYSKASNENEVHLNGVLYIRSEDFWGIFGYDERIQTYGWDDEDLYKRLDNRGIKRQVVNYDLVLHYPHGNEARGQKGVKFPQVEVDVNSLLLDRMELWSKTVGTDCSRYTVANTWPGRIVLKAERVPKSLQARSNEDQVLEVKDLAIGRRLHDEYGIPWDLLGDLEYEDKDLLLGDFLALSGSTGVSDTVAAKMIVIDCAGDILQRIVSVIYANALAKAHKRALLVVWDEEAFPVAFTDVFDKFTGVAKQMRTAFENFETATEWDPAFGNFGGVDTTAGQDQKLLAKLDSNLNVYVKAKRFSFRPAEMTTVPLAANVQVRAGDLGTVGMIGVVAQTSDDLQILMKAIREETGNSQARVFIVTGDKKVVSGLENPLVGATYTDCSTPSSKECAIATAVDVGALAATSVIIARSGSSFALAARGIRADVEVHFIV
ncbi:hypothetical protein NDN08_000063 [Rhodosorus marinus]|uniref:Glycosyltransferase 2-like domain-containing protein n=1 Tax=Rhodosorus marinus TaxID=101924 RepID=A0AAV8UHJ4_9RHOD|nr:hypothetical protein NDN08_000063 [Rhodosorus marinus]